jgi:hypothetical protein
VRDLKKMWNQYSYAIILVVLSCITAFVLTFIYDGSNKEEFKKVTVSDGDSLWEMADEYAVQHELSPQEFVKWVKRHNEIDGDRIFPGDELVIPVLNDLSGIELAGGKEHR